MHPSLKLQPCSCPALSPSSSTSAFPAREMAHKATFLASPWAATLRSGATGPALLRSIGLSPLRWQGKPFQASLAAPGPSNLTSSARQAGHSPACSRRDHGGDQAGLSEDPRCNYCKCPTDVNGRVRMRHYRQSYCSSGQHGGEEFILLEELKANPAAWPPRAVCQDPELCSPPGR